MQTGSSFSSTLRLAFALCTALCACSGSISGVASGVAGDDEGPSGDEPSPPPRGGAAQEPLHPADAESLCAATGPGVGRAQTRRFTTLQYENTVRELLRIGDVPTATFLPDSKEGPFDTNTAVPATELVIDKYEAAAATLAASANLDAILPCKAADGDDACAHDFIDTFGLRAYRRPLWEEEREALRALYRVGKS